jgi:DNA polymerase elongation subunit (family B)
MKFYTNVRRDVPNDVILYRGVENGKRVVKRERFEPTFYRIDRKSTSGFKTPGGTPVTPLEFNGMNEASRYWNKNQKDNHQQVVFGPKDYQLQYITEHFPDEELQYNFEKLCIAPLDIETTCQDGFPNVDEAKEQITVITVHNSLDKKYYVFGLEPSAWIWDHSQVKGRKTFSTEKLQNDEVKDIKKDIVYKSFKSEEEMLQAFLKFWNEIMPDVVTGWNISFFDIPYLYNRLKRLFGTEEADKLSPFKVIKSHEVVIFNKPVTKYTIYGVAILDYLDLYKKFMPGDRASYKLDYIAQFELGKKKIDFEGPMHLFYKENYPEFVEYNIYDVTLVVELEYSMRLIELAIHMAYMAKVNFEQIFSPVRLIESLCYNYLITRGVVFPPRVKGQSSGDRSITGAHVKHPAVGTHDWVVSFDLNSLYPSIIIQQNMSPETVIDNLDKFVTVEELVNKEVDLSKLKEHDITMCANGHFFDVSKRGFFPEIVDKIYSERKANKKKMIETKIKLQGKDLSKAERKKLEVDKNVYHIKQYSQKILLNSIYGATANEYFTFYDTRIAEGITRHGQLVIQWAERHINQYLNKLLKTDNVDYVIGIDTDSLYITLDALVEQVIPNETDKNKIVNFLDNVCQKKLEPLLDKCYDQLKDYTNAYEQRMVMKREVIASRGIWTGKKHYALCVYDDEGVRLVKPKIKDVGLESRKSSTPEYIRRKLLEGYKILLEGDEQQLLEFVANTKKEYESLPLSEIAYNRGVSYINKYKDNDNLYGSGCPLHVKAAILYNHNLKKHKLDNVYPLINEGDKIKFLYLQEPNTIHDKVIGFIDQLPDEFGLQGNIDYKTNFDKSFMKPLEELAKHNGWSVYMKPQSLESYFC